jgi:hypothetical protein
VKHTIAISTLLLLGLAPLNAAAQQFQEQAGLLPLPTNFWTEGTTVVDADEDGRWDCLFVHANGWEKPGDFAATGTFGLPLILLVNSGTSGGNPVFVDQSATYLPSLAIHGKGASVADFDGDGHDDIVVAVAFLARQHLLIKDPATLAWSDESVARLPSMQLNCYGAGVGDLDDDGTWTSSSPMPPRPTFSRRGARRACASTTATASSPSKPRGSTPRTRSAPRTSRSSTSTTTSTSTCSSTASRHRRSSTSTTGKPTFTEDDTLIPAAVSVGDATYETEWADLDNDNDIDGTIMSLSFYSEGTAQSLLSDTGTLSFSSATSTMTGLPPGEFEDDNEFVFIDADDDGDLDVITVSLQHPEDKLYFNSGTFGRAS